LAFVNRAIDAIRDILTAVDVELTVDPQMRVERREVSSSPWKPHRTC